jgi:hypothetical protein
MDGRGLGLGAKLLQVELALGQHDVKGHHAEEGPGDADAPEHDKAPGTPPPGPGAGVVGRDDAEMAALLRSRLRLEGAAGTGGVEADGHQAAS